MPSLSRTDSENARTVFFSHIYETMAPEHSVNPQFTVNTRPRERKTDAATRRAIIEGARRGEHAGRRRQLCGRQSGRNALTWKCFVQ